MSGALGNKYANDLHLFLPSASDTKLTIHIENKRRSDLHKYYALAESNTKIDGFCYILNEKSFIDVCRGKEIISTRTVLDIGHKSLHNHFSQDASDIVTLHEVYKDWVFCVPGEIIKSIQEVMSV